MACDEAELMRLATEYRRKYKSPYELNDMHMRSLETDAEKSIALNLEAKINDIDVNYTMKHFYNELGSKGDIFKNRKSIKRVASKVSPKGTPKTSPKGTPKTTLMQYAIHSCLCVMQNTTHNHKLITPPSCNFQSSAPSAAFSPTRFFTTGTYPAMKSATDTIPAASWLRICSTNASSVH